jgi:hypothetical protein
MEPWARREKLSGSARTPFARETSFRLLTEADRRASVSAASVKRALRPPFFRVDRVELAGAEHVIAARAFVRMERHGVFGVERQVAAVGIAAS